MLYTYSLNPWFVAVGLNTVLLAIAWIVPKKLLTPAGLFHAWLLGVLVWGTLGWQGYIVVMFYFLVGSAVTRIKLQEKEAAGIAEKRSGARGPENVWGSALTGALCALGTLLARFKGNELIASLLILGYVASFSTKLADTCASEVGKAYGKRTFLITNLQPVPRGTEGAVSLEGTVAGVVASGAIAFVGWGVGLIDMAGCGRDTRPLYPDLLGVLFCILAAFVATNLESVIGATLQTRFDWLTNEFVNVLNTLIGAATAILFALVWQWWLS